MSQSLQSRCISLGGPLKVASGVGMDWTMTSVPTARIRSATSNRSFISRCSQLVSKAPM